MKTNVFRTFAGTAMAAAVMATGTAWAQEDMSTKSAMEYFTDNELFVGVNMGNSLDAYRNWESPHEALETAWGNVEANQRYFDALAAHGFKIVRIPVTYIGKTGIAPDYTIDEAWLDRIETVVGYAKNAGLRAIINIHHDGAHGNGTWMHINSVTPEDMETNVITQRFVRIWEQVAERFKDHGDYLMFQAFNELHRGDWSTGTAAEYQIINYWNQRFTDAVRGTGGNNRTRYLCYYGYNTHASIASTNRTRFVLPTDTVPGNGTRRMVVGFHFYDPFPFAHDGGVIKDSVGNIIGDAENGDIWDTPQNRNLINTTFGNFKSAFVDDSIPVIIGECGPARYLGSRDADVAHQNRLSYIEFMYGAAKANGITPIYWETGAVANEFSLFPRNSGTPNSTKSTEVVKAMIEAVGGTWTGGGDDDNEYTMLDDFTDLDAISLTLEPWYAYVMGNSSVGNARDADSNIIVKTDLGYAELFDINADQPDWGHFAGVAIALSTADNGTVYDLGEGEGFTYKFRGAAHAFAVNIDYEGYQATFIGNGNVLANNTDNWETVTITDFTRDIYDGWCAANAANAVDGQGGSCNATEAAAITLNLSDITALVWTVRGFTEVWKLEGGKLELDDIQAIGIVDLSRVGTSVASNDREIPQTDQGAESAVVVPVAKSAFSLTVGPNPAGKNSGAVNFYLAGASVKSGSLTIYDATGKVVNRLAVGGSAVSWDLKDRKGRPVSEGTYLARGSVRLLSGKREKVSVMVNVR